MTENRPVPEYGEYATPEEQRERMGLPPVADVADVAAEGAVAGTAAAAVPAPGQRYSPPPPEFVPEEGTRRARRAAGIAPGQVAGTTTPGVSSAGMANAAAPADVSTLPVPRDRGISIFLLILGALSMIGYIANFQRLSAYVQLSFDQLDMGTITTGSQMDIIGWVALGLLIALYVVTLRWTTVRMRARKLSWFIPLAAGVLAALITLVAIGLAVFGDPAFMEMVNSGTVPTIAP